MWLLVVDCCLVVLLFASVDDDNENVFSLFYACFIVIENQEPMGVRYSYILPPL